MSRFGRRRTVWGPPTVYATTLDRASTCGADFESCRVCHKPIQVGDPCLARGWHVGFAHQACGWFTLGDLSAHEREAAHRFVRGEGLTREQCDLLVRGGWGRVGRRGDFEWTDRGALLVRQLFDVVMDNAFKEAS